MQQSSKAQDQTLGEWFITIKQGQVKLPRFQRHEAWDKKRITSFLNTIINNLPVGITLALEVAREEVFISRYIVSAEPEVQGIVTKHLLDGQQRLTAFWRTMHNNYDDEDYFIYLPCFDQRQNPSEEVEVVYESRWTNKGNNKRMPVWVDDPEECLKRGLFPIELLCPGDQAKMVSEWIEEAIKINGEELRKKYEEREKLRQAITTLRERVTHFNLPYLSLPSNTPKDVALQVFINMNTNSKQLSVYDIIVAEVESVTGQSLHDRKDQLVRECPKAVRFGDIGDMILTTSALLQKKTPTNKGMLDMDKAVLIQNWDRLKRGLKRMADLLDSQGVFDGPRLPTSNVLAVVAAAYDFVPEDGDFVAKAEKLLRAYLWSSFFTDRYENSAASRTYADFNGVQGHFGIKGLLEKRDFDQDELSKVPIFNRKEHPLQGMDALKAAGWPKSTRILARGILAVSNYFGAHDFADDRRASYESIQNREYHHIFPSALLSDAGIKGDRALNCALITWKTNRDIGRKDPLDYLKERVEWANKAEVSDRLKTHLVSFDDLSRAQYQGLEGENLKIRLDNDFDEFMDNRARLVHEAVKDLATGSRPSLDSIWKSLKQGTVD